MFCREMDFHRWRANAHPRLVNDIGVVERIYELSQRQNTNLCPVVVVAGDSS